MFKDLVITGGHGILKERLSQDELNLDKQWFISNKRYSVIDNMYVQRAAFSNDFIKIQEIKNFTCYSLCLRGSENRRYGIWANGVLSESTFKSDMIKTFDNS
jgi:hypothetical protein